MSGEGLSRGTAMGIEMANVNADLDLKAAQAEALRADAANKRANTETEDKSRDIFIENMKQSGVSTWLENIVKKVRLQGVPEENEVTAVRNAVYNSGVAYGNDAPEFKQMNADLLKTIAEERNLNTGSELNDKKIQGYWQELMNATAHADADQIRAAAIKLQTEWSTGEFVNWKTWADYAESALQLLSKAIPTKGKNPTTTIKDGYSEKYGNYSEVIKTK